MPTPRFPQKIADLVPWLTLHAAAWKLAPSGVGLSAGQANALDTAAKALASAVEEAQLMREKSRTATTVQDEALRTALTLLRQDIRIIDAFAENSASPAAVWQTAGIAPPNAPQTLPPPGAVSGVSVGIDIVSGAPVLRWRGNNPPGGGSVSYIVKRRLPGDAPGLFTFIGIAGSSGPDARTFKDETLPLGTDSVAYTITPQRGGVSGPSTQVSVQFGVTGGGERGAQFSVSDQPPPPAAQPKMAA